MSARDLFERRKRRNRYAINVGANLNPRLSVFRSSKNIYAQVIDDLKGKTLVSASTIEASQRNKKKTGANIEAATNIGSLIAERALKKGVNSVTFDPTSSIFPAASNPIPLGNLIGYKPDLW